MSSFVARETLQKTDIPSMEENRCSQMLNSSEAGISWKRKLLSEKYSTLHLLVMMANITEQGFVSFVLIVYKSRRGDRFLPSSVHERNLPYKSHEQR